MMNVSYRLAVALAQSLSGAQELFDKHALGIEPKPWEQKTNEERLSAVKFVQAYIEGRVTDPKTAHEIWMKVRQEEGWTFGTIKNPEAKESPYMVPYDELDPKVQAKDLMVIKVLEPFYGL